MVELGGAKQQDSANFSLYEDPSQDSILEPADQEQQVRRAGMHYKGSCLNLCSVILLKLLLFKGQFFFSHIFFN